MKFILFHTFISCLCITTVYQPVLGLAGSKFGCVKDDGTVTLKSLCPNSDERPQIMSASYGSWKQLLRHVCPNYPSEEPISGWPICSNNSVDLVTSKLSFLCDYTAACSFVASQMFNPDEGLNCFTGKEFMYFDVTFKCYPSRDVCSSYVSKTERLSFKGVQAGQRSYANCPDYDIYNNQAVEKCLGRNQWDEANSETCPQTFFNKAVFSMVNTEQQTMASIDKFRESWDLFNLGFYNQSKSLTIFKEDTVFLVTTADQIQFKDLSMVLDVGPMYFMFNSNAPQLFFPRSGLPRLILQPKLISKPPNCQAATFTVVFGEVDLTAYTDSFKIQNLNSAIVYANISTEPDCEPLTGKELNQSIKFHTLLNEVVSSDMMSACVMWPEIGASIEDVMLTVDLCQTEQISKKIVQCSCANTSAAFFAVINVVRPTTTTSTTTASTTTTTTTEKEDSSTDDEKDNSTDNGDEDGESGDKEGTTTASSNLSTTTSTDSDGGSFPIKYDIPWIMFSASCFSNAIITYLIPLIVILKLICQSLQQKCYSCCVKTTSRIKLSVTAAATNSNNQKDSTRLVKEGNSESANGGASHRDDFVSKTQYRPIFVLYGPLVAFMFATANISLFVASYTVRRDPQWNGKIGFTMSILFFSLAYFYLLFGFLIQFDKFNQRKSTYKLLLLPSVLASCFSLAIYFFANVPSNARICWTTAESIIVIMFLSLLLLTFLSGIVWMISFGCETEVSFSGDSSKTMDWKIALLWTMCCCLLIPEPFLLFYVTSDWSIMACSLLLLAAVLCPIAAVGVALRIYFSELHVVKRSNRSNNGDALLARTIVLEPIVDKNAPSQVASNVVSVTINNNNYESSAVEQGGNTHDDMHLKALDQSET